MSSWRESRNRIWPSSPGVQEIRRLSAYHYAEYPIDSHETGFNGDPLGISDGSEQPSTSADVTNTRANRFDDLLLLEPPSTYEG